MGMPIARAAVEGRPTRGRRPTRRRAAHAPDATGTAAIRQLAGDLGLEAGDLLGATVLHEVTHRILDRHAAGGAHPLEAAHRRLSRTPDRADVAGTLRAFRPAFPTGSPLPDPAADDPANAARTTAGRALEELVLLRLHATNPALSGVHALFDDAELAGSTEYLRVLAALDDPLPAPVGGGPTDALERPVATARAGGIMELLRGPVAASPDSLAGQLRWVRRHWAGDLTPAARRRLTLALDLLAEEAHARTLRDRDHLADGDGHVEGPELGSADDPERFSADAPWMPRLVLLAKNAYVWLEQLSRDLGRPITTLDDVPAEVLAAMAAEGVNGLWLIGLWERSRASREIKRRMRQPGRGGLRLRHRSLRHRRRPGRGCGPRRPARPCRRPRHPPRQRHGAQPHGHRLHLGHASTPSWFICARRVALSRATRFSGPDLSPDTGVVIKLEDHYWDRRDAAVVFRREDRGHRRGPLHLPRQRRHSHPVERHGPARLPAAPTSARPSSDRSWTSPGVSRSSASTPP